MRLKLKPLLNTAAAVLIIMLNISVCSAWQNPDEIPPDESFHLLVSPTLSLYYGSANEYVFNYGHKISELNWDVKPLICAGVNAAAYVDKFSLTGSYSQAFNRSTGSMRDYDWDDSGTLTNYSKHDQTQGGCLFLDIAGGYSLVISDIFKMGLKIGYRYSHLVFFAENGYLRYKSNNWVQEPAYGYGVIYQQKYSIPYTGYILSATLPWFEIHSDFNYSFIGACSCKDSHLKTAVDYYDSMKYIQYFSAGLYISRSLLQNLKISGGADIQYIPLTKGDTYSVDTTSGNRSLTTRNTAGIMLRTVDVQIRLTAVL